MDCYYHNAVPSVAVCHDCTQTICATCRDDMGICPGCRLERRLDAAAAARPGLAGARGPQNPPPGRTARGPRTAAAPEPTYREPSRAVATISSETRGLLALGYPLWPLAALALLDPKRSPAVRRQAMQALGLNFGLFGLWIALGAVAQVPLLGISAWPLLAVLFPFWMVATVVYGVKVWNGDDVRVPLVSDWIDEREARRAARKITA
ncbi:MAG: hypothetical protein NVSMB19_04620 [Vulcanimicrobiaceae bacterium]